MDNLVQIFSSGSTGIGVWMLMFAASFAGGVLASISPCSLAMLPLIIGYVGGYSKETPLRTFIQLCCFIFGTAIVFSIIGIISRGMPIVNNRGNRVDFVVFSPRPHIYVKIQNNISNKIYPYMTTVPRRCRGTVILRFKFNPPWGRRLPKPYPPRCLRTWRSS